MLSNRLALAVGDLQRGVDACAMAAWQMSR
jgi:hypothetical protein